MSNNIQRALEKFQEIRANNKNKCFEEYKSKDGKCYGHIGNDKSTDFLALECIHCPHHSM